MLSPEALDNLAGSRLRQLRQEKGRMIVELDDTAEGAVALVCEAAAIAHGAEEVMLLNTLPAWHHARTVAWADVLAGCLVVALESGLRLSLRARAVHLEREV